MSTANKKRGDHKPNPVTATIHLDRMSPCDSLRPTRNLERAVLVRLLLGLAPDGVCTAFIITNEAVSSYLAFSPLPFQAVCFLLHFPSPRGARVLPGILPCGVRTFLTARITGLRGRLAPSIDISIPESSVFATTLRNEISFCNNSIKEHYQHYRNRSRALFLNTLNVPLYPCS